MFISVQTVTNMWSIQVRLYCNWYSIILVNAYYMFIFQIETVSCLTFELNAEKVKRLMCKLLDDLRCCSSAPVASVCFWPVLCYLRGWLSASGA